MPRLTSMRLLATLAVGWLTLMAGCAGARAPLAGNPAEGTPHTQKVPEESITRTDACPMRLHDLSGGLLLYHFLNGRLPDTLQALADLDQGPPLPAAVCPTSGTPYIYRPEGFLLPERRQRIVVYDASPSHSGMRWAISVEDNDGTSPLVTKVIAVPESFFLLHPTR